MWQFERIQHCALDDYDTMSTTAKVIRTTDTTTTGGATSTGGATNSYDTDAVSMTALETSKSHIHADLQLLQQHG